MRIFVLLAFLVLPLLEIYLFIKVGGLIGALPTVLLVILTALVGVTLMRLQGLLALGRVQADLRQGRMPAVSLLEGMFLLAAGFLLVLPGFFTDTLGALLLIPPLRRALARSMLTRAILRTTAPRRRPPGSGPPPPRTLEGEYRREDD